MCGEGGDSYDDRLCYIMIGGEKPSLYHILYTHTHIMGARKPTYIHYRYDICYREDMLAYINLKNGAGGWRSGSGRIREPLFSGSCKKTWVAAISNLTKQSQQANLSIHMSSELDSR